MAATFNDRDWIIQLTVANSKQGLTFLENKLCWGEGCKGLLISASSISVSRESRHQVTMNWRIQLEEQLEYKSIGTPEIYCKGLFLNYHRVIPKPTLILDFCSAFKISFYLSVIEIWHADHCSDTLLLGVFLFLNCDFAMLIMKSTV